MQPTTAESSHTPSQGPAYRMGAMLIGMGITHFVAPKPFDQIVPAGASAAATPTPHSNQAYYFAWTATGTWRGAMAHGDGKIGSVLALSDPSMPFPLQADLRLHDLHIALAGTLSDPVHLGALDLNLAISGNSMSHLYALTGVNLPTTAPFKTRGRLLARIHQGVFDTRLSQRGNPLVDDVPLRQPVQCDGHTRMGEPYALRIQRDSAIIDQMISLPYLYTITRIEYGGLAHRFEVLQDGQHADIEVTVSHR